MKNILSCLFLFSFTFIGLGQDYMPMLDANACWGRKYVDNISLPPIVEDRGIYFIFSNNIEVINGLEYTRLFDEYDPLGEDSLVGYLREDIISQQIFYLNESEEFSWLNCGGEEILLYDFSVEVGDTVYHCPNSDLYYVVQSIEIVEEYTNPEVDFGGFGGGRIYEVYSSEFNFSTIYEGVGTNIGPIHEFPNVSAPGNEILANYTLGCEFILSANDILKTEGEIFPNPVQDLLNIKVSEERKLSEMKIYNLSGQLQMSHKILDNNYSVDIAYLPKGLYFITGHDEKGRQIFNRKFVKIN